MARTLLQRTMTWAEDRATQRCDPSAVPGAKTGAGAAHCPAPLPFPPLRDWHQSDKPSRHDAATFLARCPSRLANSERQQFQFPVNQDTFEPLPPYAPELNPVEQCWSHTKYTDLANFIPDHLDHLQQALDASITEQGKDQHLLRSFFAHAKLPL
jgi:hypothetical protein